MNYTASVLPVDALFVADKPLETAVLLLAFNRPSVTFEVFEAIRRARPSRFYIAADGARPDRPGEAELCDQVRSITSRIDWPCSVATNFSPTNLGCKRAVSSAISWFFAQEEEGIILEDDCLPSMSFFWFCQDLLQRYRADTRVWQICGTSFLASRLDTRDSSSYLFSKYGPIWGWASWRRAWTHYDRDLTQWPTMSKDALLRSAYPINAERTRRRKLGSQLYRNEIDTWDYQWGFVKNYQSGLSIIPRKNLIVNIGFDAQATHTQAAHPLAPTRALDLQFPLVHPPFVLADDTHDELYRAKLVVGGLVANIQRKLLSRLNKMTRPEGQN